MLVNMKVVITIAQAMAFVTKVFAFVTKDLLVTIVQKDDWFTANCKTIRLFVKQVGQEKAAQKKFVAPSA